MDAAVGTRITAGRCYTYCCCCCCVLLSVAAAEASSLPCRAMALTQSASVMALGLKGERSMARRINSVPSLGSNVDFNYGRPNHAVSACIPNSYCCCRSRCFFVSSTTTRMIPPGTTIGPFLRYSLCSTRRISCFRRKLLEKKMLRVLYGGGGSICLCTAVRVLPMTAHRTPYTTGGTYAALPFLSEKQVLVRKVAVQSTIGT